MTDVLVVGAGPTGLTLASELLRHGVSCRIIDKLPRPPDVAKATGIMPRTLEVLEDMGCLPPFLEQGLHVLHMDTVLEDGRRIMEMTFEEIGTPHPLLLCQEQSRTEEILRGHLAGLGGEVERPVVLTALRQRADAVEVVLEHADRTERVEVRYVVGCDGAHSTVRHLLELDFVGASYPEDFVLGHGRFDWDYPRDRVATFLSKAGCAYANPLPGDTWLGVADLAGEQQERVHDGTPTAEELGEIFSERVSGSVRVSDLRWSAFFRIHHRQVESYQRDRVFLAGDAAHIHSPFGGQGMNTGIQDAYNLGWKLALVVRGVAAPSLLASYDAERRPVGKAVLDFTNQLQVSSSLRGSVRQGVRNAILRCVGHIELVGHHVADQLGETLYTYRAGPLAAEHQDPCFHLHGDARHPNLGDCRAFHAGPHAGARAPDASLEGMRIFDLLRGPHFSLLLFEGTHASDQETEDLAAFGLELTRRLPLGVRPFLITNRERARDPGLEVVHDPRLQAHDRYGAKGQCMYLIRPDGYVAYRAQPVSDDRAERYLRDQLQVAR